MRGYRAALAGSPLGIAMLIFAIIVVLYFFLSLIFLRKLPI